MWSMLPIAHSFLANLFIKFRRVSFCLDLCHSPNLRQSLLPVGRFASLWVYFGFLTATDISNTSLLQPDKRMQKIQIAILRIDSAK